MIDRKQDNLLMVGHGRHQLVKTIHSLHRIIVKAPVQYKGQPSDTVLTNILDEVAVPY